MFAGEREEGERERAPAILCHCAAVRDGGLLPQHKKSSALLCRRCRRTHLGQETCGFSSVETVTRAFCASSFFSSACQRSEKPGGTDGWRGNKPG